MKKLYHRLIAGVATTIIVYGIFFGCQVSFGQNYDRKLVTEADSINRQTVQRLGNGVLQSLEMKVEVMERYVEAEQRNLDLWLKMLALILSILIGLSVFHGWRMHDTAKEELENLRKIKDDINKLAGEAEDRLKSVNAKISHMEDSASKGLAYKRKLTQQLNEIGVRKVNGLSDSDKKIIEESISESLQGLQKNDIESLKNLYMAKGIKSITAKNWDDAVRLLSLSADLDEKNHVLFFNRGLAYLELSKIISDFHKTEFVNKSILDSSEAIRLKPDLSLAFNNRGIAHSFNSEHEKAVSDFNEAIRLKPNESLYYTNRAATYKKMGIDDFAERDIAKANEMDGIISISTSTSTSTSTP
jgi:tetratricopeptide (TPR) repeat protein